MNNNILFDGLRIVVAPVTQGLWGIAYGTVYGLTLAGVNQLSGSYFDEEKQIKSSIIWGIAEHALRGLVSAILISQLPANRNIADKAIILASGVAGTVLMLKNQSVDGPGLGFNALIFALKLWKV